MKLTKEKILGLSGSLIFCIIMFLILWLSILKTVLPAMETGILVNFGNDLEGALGMYEPMNTGEGDNDLAEPDIPDVSEQPTLSTPQETAITQNIEQTASINAENRIKEEEKRKQEQLRKEQEEQKRQAELERQRQQQAINNQVAGAFGRGNTPSEGQGTGAGQGNQGSPQGSSDHGANSGVGGYGDVALAGRRLVGSLPRPAYSVQEEGVIVVDITVNKNGNVISAIIGRGTTIDNATLRNSALEAARKARFNTVTANENLSGKITYRYYLR